MLEFTEEYFQEEVRSGFTVSETMKRYWAAQMEVLQVVIEICEKLNLTYYAFWGTLLGVVRHRGFIPWDDDIDIAMKREDYQKFLQIAKKELPSGWHMRSIYEEEKWTQCHSRITNELEIDISEKRLSLFHGCPFIVGVDIFSLDYFPRDRQAAETQKLLLNMIHAIVTSVKYMHGDIHDATEEEMQELREGVDKGLVELEMACHITFDKNKSIENQLLKLFDKICMLYGSQDADLLVYFPGHVKGKEIFLPIEWMETDHMPFENMILAVPSDSDKVLRAYYGDYMVFEKGKQDHGYPAYKKELEILHENGLWLDVQE